jgi:hypothetical protein
LYRDRWGGGWLCADRRDRQTLKFEVDGYIAIKFKAYGNQASPFLRKTDGYILDNNSQVLTGQGIELILPPGKVHMTHIPRVFG